MTTIITFRARAARVVPPARSKAACNDSRERPPLTPAERGIVEELVSTYSFRRAHAQQVAECLEGMGQFAALAHVVTHTGLGHLEALAMLRRWGVLS